ncbi:phage tail sheath subtilisin-like domain-containing protein [Microbacterium lacus]|uniref:phage tail sheath family protein n=1 Tax=Microbacterium lacus TaxID=415217 RepID=UPI003850A487
MPTPIETVPTSVAAFIGASTGPSEPAKVATWSEFLAAWPDSTALAVAVEEFFRNGGQSAWVSPIARVTASAVRRAVNALHPDVSLVVIAAEPAVSPTVVAAAAKALQGRPALLLIEPRWVSVKAAREALAAGAEVALGASAADVVAYWPRLRRKGAFAPVSPLGAVAGVFARTDATLGFWRAPAGNHAALHGTPSLAIALTDSDTELLTRHGINTIRSFPGRGTLVWGARTTSPDPEWRYVSVRRLSMTLTESIRRGLQWAVFEPNAEPLWNQMRRDVSAFLLAHFRQGALVGATPEDAFFVRCDRDTMTAADIAAGRLIVTFGFAPLLPAEFIVQTIRLQIA